MTLDLPTLLKELRNLQTRLEKYEDLVAGGGGDREHNLKMLEYYKGESAKIRAKMLELGTQQA